jgi:hypothetical protein
MARAARRRPFDVMNKRLYIPIIPASASSFRSGDLGVGVAPLPTRFGAAFVPKWHSRPAAGLLGSEKQIHIIYPNIHSILSAALARSTGKP